MQFDAQTIDLLKQSFAAATAGGAFASTFYDRLFAVDPALRLQFDHVDMRAQGAMIEQSVRLVLDHLDNLATAMPVIESLGYRHKNYGVKPEHYHSAAAAFLQALEMLAPAAFDEAARAGWTAALGTLAQAMIDGGEKLYQARRDRIENFAQINAGEDYMDPYVTKFFPALSAQEAAQQDFNFDVDVPPSIQVDFVGDKAVEVAPLQTILDISLQNDIPHHYICGGTGRCSTCRVSIVDGLENCLPRNQVELQMAAMKGFPDDLRLACQTRIAGPVRLRRLVRDPQDVVDSVEFTRGQSGREMNLAVMFVDIIDFTSFSEKNLPYDIVHALNRFFDATGSVIDQHNGYIDKYLGDGVMAIFGLKSGGGSSACRDAVQAALDISRELARINHYIQQHLGQTFSIGIGIDYGAVVVGNIGSRLRRQFTALGDVVNVASRLEMEAKRRGFAVLVSRAVKEALADETVAFGDGLALAIRGKAAEQFAYPVLPA